MTPPPQWFPDPQNPAQMRYWDGAAWTAHVQPNPQAVQQEPFVPVSQSRSSSDTVKKVVLTLLAIALLGAVYVQFIKKDAVPS